jgi:flagellar hook-length control protein FliK
MFFNPLFISNASAATNVDSPKEGKFTNSNYLFADIINVSNEKLSNSEVNIEVDTDNISLFNNLKSIDISLSENTEVGKNQYLGNLENLSSFLLNILGGKDLKSEATFTDKNKNNSSDVAVIPEQIAQLVDLLNSEKISLPLNNNGKNIFVEIQKFDAESSAKNSSTENVKLTNSASNESAFSALDFKRIISDISLALEESFNSENTTISEEKIQAIVSKLETAFSSLVKSNNDSFQPQKNILGNLISNVEKEFKLNNSESTELKNIIVAQFAKVVNGNSGKVVTGNSGKEGDGTSVKAEFQPNSSITNDALVYSEEIALSQKEKELIKSLNGTSLNASELKEKVELKLSEVSNNTELKMLLNKLEKFESAKSVDISSKVNVNSEEKMNSKLTIIGKVKSGIKNILASGEVDTPKSENEKYLFTLKSEKTPESTTLNENLLAKKKTQELLKTSIYSSKESVDLSNVKVIPLNEEIRKVDSKITDNNFKKEIHQKINTELKIVKNSENEKNSKFENNTASQNEQNLNGNNNSTEILAGDSSKQSFNKEVQANSEAAAQKENISKKEQISEVKISSNDIKISETATPKASLVDNQIKNQMLNVNDKTIYKTVDIKNIKAEISHLIEKGEKKSVEFQLNPENLGKLAIKLEVINKIVSASIKVDNEATQQLVQNSLEGLKTSLNQNGVQFNSLNVSLSDSEGKNQKFFKQKRKNNNSAKMNVEGFDENFAPKKLGYNNYDFIA